MQNEPKKVDDLTPEVMNLMGDVLKNMLPQGMGFSLVLFDFGDGLREFKYVSNAQRQDMIGALEAIVLKWKNEEIISKN